MYRELNKLQIIYNNDCSKKYIAYIVNMDVNKLGIYIPELELMEYIDLYSDDLGDIVMMEMVDGKLIINDKISLEIYQKVEVEITFILSSKELAIRVVSPDIYYFI